MSAKLEQPKKQTIHLFKEGYTAWCGARLNYDFSNSRVDVIRVNCEKCIAKLRAETEEE